MFCAVEMNHHLKLTALYSKELFKEETIRRYLDYFLDIAGSVSDNIDDPMLLDEIKISHDFIDQKLEIPQTDFGF